jgi:acyl-CoA dehydrogenase
MISFDLTDEQRMLQQTARDFATSEVAPCAERIRKADGAIDPWQEVRPVFLRAADLGFTKLLLPEEHGGVGGSALDHVVVMEELGAADHGIASTYLNISATAPLIILHGGTEEQRAAWLPEIAKADDFVLASASSEPDVAGADSFCPSPDPRIGLKSTAARDGDDYVLNGAKSGFSTNAGAARGYFVMARTDLAKPARESTAMFFVPADTPGLTVGKRTRLSGWETACQAEVILEDVRIPADRRVGGEHSDAGMIFFRILPYLASGFAATFVGLARAAFDLAFAYAHERISWGQPIIEHQAVSLKLADMAVEIEAARLMVWRAAAAADAGDPQAGMLYAPAAKTMAVDTAIRCAERAMKILGSYGITQEYPAARMLNDAWIGDSCDGTRDVLRLNIVQAMRMAAAGGPPPGH